MTQKKKTNASALMNQLEYKGFLGTALAWQGSVTPRILPRVIAAGFYSLAILYLIKLFPHYSLPITPFEYTGAILGLLLVVRVNAGINRWWEARMFWGHIVNQSRNLAIAGYQYTEKKGKVALEFLNYAAALPHTIRMHLRDQRSTERLENLLGQQEAQKTILANHMPMHISIQIANLLHKLKSFGLSDFAFHRAEEERSKLIDAVGACERIRNTPIPFVLAIKTRRFILFFLLLLPFPLIEQAKFFTPLLMMLISYPLFSLDEIGIELQMPFNEESLSHLPLNELCEKIEDNIKAIPEVKEV